MRKNGAPLIMPSEAADLILDRTAPLPSETIALLEAPGRFLAEDIVSATDIPPFDNSAMDGYALQSSLLHGAAPSSPITLPISGEAKAGDGPDGEVPAGTAWRIMTGAPMPRGCDTVVPVEDTMESGGNVSFITEAKPGDHIRRAGEDISRGMTVLRRGDRVTPAVLGLLASLNMTEVRVPRKPVVAVISTGDEIADPGAPARPWQIRNSNAFSLYGEIFRCGAVPRYLGIARDTMEETRRLFAEAIQCDVIITTGGVSMGSYDFVPDVLREMGSSIVFETIRMKPGKPCVFATIGKTLFFGLPGNPVSTMVSFIQFVRPALLSLVGASRLRLPEVKAVLQEPITKKKGRVHYIRGRFTVEEGSFAVSTTGSQGSGILRSMHEANCLIILPVESPGAEAGDIVTIQLFGHEEIR